ncbi:uncharacterized protein JCM6883_006272 [Sporobolomyces salmoneus]|uniref:uncharacterized protein n=1 Tax=Sporobolomyces salmoneus TaxID=183962 RepID=UPI00317C73AB
MQRSAFALRPRLLVQFGVVLTILVTLWLTFDSSSKPPSPLSIPSSVPSSPSLSRSPPILLKGRPRNLRSSRENTSSSPWRLSKPKEELEPCEKIFLFTFVPWWGFASEFILYIRAKSMADKLGYTFLPDDKAWNYGRLSSYFEPMTLSCVPPADWDDYRKAYPIHQGQSWRFDKKGRPRKRLRYSRAFLSNLDDWTRETYFVGNSTVQSELETLRRNDERHRETRDRWILEEGGTLPSVFEGIFQEHADAVRDTWTINAELRDDVNDLEIKTGMSEPRRFEGIKVGRGPVIGLHIRLGDKATEYVHDAEEMGISNKFGNLTVYVEAAHDAYRRLVSTDYPSLSDSSSRRFSPLAQPTLLVMTAEPGVAARLAEIPLAEPFRIVQTPMPLLDSTATDTKDGSKRLKDLEVERNQAGGKDARPKAYAGKGLSEYEPIPLNNSTDLRDGYTQSTFNSKSLEERVEHTRAFVRDLALLTSESVDALVVSGASNIGRLAMLIGGSDAVVGPRDSLGRALGGKIRSIDAHWYPTSYPSSVYTRYTDVEDLENAAFLPEEQLRRGKKKQKDN